MINQNLPKSPREAYEQGYREGYEAAQKALRDDMAMRAMQGLLSSPDDDHGNYVGDDQISKRAYQIADAMLKAREASHPDTL